MRVAAANVDVAADEAELLVDRDTSISGTRTIIARIRTVKG